MQFNGKALYNILRMNWLQDPSIDLKPWQVEDLRSVQVDELFQRLETFKIFLDRASLNQYAAECDSPEELGELLLYDVPNQESYNQGYLILFELWHRLCPEKRSLSIICDELDHLIDLYERRLLENEEALQGILSEIESILDDDFDQGGNPEESFQWVCTFCSHDFEKFLYEYITSQINSDNELYASELIDGYYQYVSLKLWFDLLRIRLFAATDLEEATISMERLLERMQEKPQFDLLIEILLFLTYMGESDHFRLAYELAMSRVTYEDELRKLLVIISDYLSCLDCEDKEKEVHEMFESRKQIPANQPVDPADSTLTSLKEILTIATTEEL